MSILASKTSSCDLIPKDDDDCDNQLSYQHPNDARNSDIETMEGHLFQLGQAYLAALASKNELSTADIRKTNIREAQPGRRVSPPVVPSPHVIAIDDHDDDNDNKPPSVAKVTITSPSKRRRLA